MDSCVHCIIHNVHSEVFGSANNSLTWSANTWMGASFGSASQDYWWCSRAFDLPLDGSLWIFSFDLYHFFSGFFSGLARDGCYAADLPWPGIPGCEHSMLSLVSHLTLMPTCGLTPAYCLTLIMKPAPLWIDQGSALKSIYTSLNAI